MPLSPDRRPPDPIAATGIKVIVVTNDPVQAAMMTRALAQSRYAYAVRQLKARDTLAGDLEAEIEAVRGRLPVIVMIDYEFVLEACEAVVAQIDRLKGDMAIERLVIRPPPNSPVSGRLRDKGVFLFDVGAELSLFALELH